eukprot:m.32559 g.32559  ORF g.32559 m.32559 type:complete len:409 (-) comp8427_c0_seq1:192-1418(-)
MFVCPIAVLKMTEEGSTTSKQDAFQQECEKIRLSQGHFKMLSHIFACNCNTRYIQEERLKLNILFPPRTCTDFPNSKLEVSINCSKPEIKESEKKNKPKPKLPPGAKCVICFEHVGVKPGLLAWNLVVNKRDFFLQPPPYPYCENHNVLIEKKHTPQAITEGTLLDIISAGKSLQGMYICSNTDKKGTGASILEHKHYQIVSKRFPICDANTAFRISKGNVNVDYLEFPAATIRLTFKSEHTEEGKKVANSLLHAWRSEAMAKKIDSSSDRQTMSYIFYMGPSSECELTLIPRTMGNMTRPTLHCIKAEFVGILEMAGFAILPGRLRKQLARLFVNKEAPVGDLQIFAQWMKEFNLSVGEERGTLLVENQAANHAIYVSFQHIIADNSAFPSRNQDIAKHWIHLAGIV